MGVDGFALAVGADYELDLVGKFCFHKRFGDLPAALLPAVPDRLELQQVSQPDHPVSAYAFV
jgi:hypothetical protein